MSPRILKIFLICVLLSNTGCREFLEALDYWTDDCWDWDDCYDSRGSYGDNGEYTTMRVVWRCPDDDAAVSGHFATSFRDVVIQEESGASVFDGNLALYAWFVTGPGRDWKTAGVKLDVVEFYFFSLINGETLILRIVNGVPESDGGTVAGTYDLIAAENAAEEGSLKNFLEALDEPHAVRSVLDIEDMFGAVADSGDFSGMIVDRGDGTFAYALDVTVMQDESPVSYGVTFVVEAQDETAEVTFQNAYGRESYTTGGTSSGAPAAASYAYSISIGSELQLTRVGEADLADFELYCGPGPALRDPVVFGAES